MQKERRILKQHTVSFYQLALCALAMLAFLLHLFTSSVSGMAYCVIIIILVCVLAFSKPVVRNGLPRVYKFCWIATILVILVNYLFRYRSNVVIIDIIVLFCGFAVILCFSKTPGCYDAALSRIKAMSCFFAFGVFLQVLAPSIYRAVIQLFPSGFRSLLMAGISATGKIRGFSTNPGFSAGYVIAGIFVVYAGMRHSKKIRRRDMTLFILLLLSLLMTNKRAPFLFLILTIAIIRILPERGTKRLKKLWTGLMIALVIIVLFFLLQDVLGQITFLKRLVVSIQSFMEGDDITSGRSKLSAWAVKLFLQNPVTGIGWGFYRTTTRGNATLLKYLDVHNVYLQLLCETGLIGFIAFISVFAVSWNMTKKSYCACISTENPALRKWKTPLLFSFAFQTYFLLYCLTGNPLYDQFYQVLYSISCSIAVAFRYVSKKQPYSGVNENESDVILTDEMY